MNDMNKKQIIIDFLNENNNTCKHLMWEDSTEEFEELITKLGTLF